MVKKTTKRRIKGGNKKTDILGPFIPQSLYTLKNTEPEKHKLEKLETNYEEKEYETQNKINELRERLNVITKMADNDATENLNINKFNFDKSDKSSKFYLQLTKYGTGILYSTFVNIVMLGAYIIDNFKYAVSLVANAGQGVIIKVAVIIIIIAIILALGFTTPIFTNPGEIIGANDISKKLLNMDVENYIITQYNSLSFLKTITDKLNNLLPDAFKYKFASISNSISYITTGKNQYEDLLINREVITNGRSDNVFHMNFKSNGDYSSEKTFCALTPKDVKFDYNSNLYSSSDYNNIDENLRNAMNYPSTYTIPIDKDDRGKFILSTDKSYYNNSNDNINNFLPKLFKTSGANKEILFNSIPITRGINSQNNTSIIAIYGTKLLNKNYKGPILKLTTINYGSPSLDNSNPIETPVYYENGEYYYYKGSVYTKLPTDRIFYVNILYDQSGNHRDFSYRQSDNKYQPEFKLVNNIGYLNFQTKNILYLEKSIDNKQMRIKAKINVNKRDKKEHYDKVQGYMNLLSTLARPMIKLRLNKQLNKDELPDTYNTDIQLDNIPNERSKNNNNKNFNSIIYSTNTIVEINVDVDINDGKDKTGIETLGTVHDDRTPSDFILTERIKDGAQLTSNIEANNFVGELYELYIYDRTKL